MKGIKSVGCDDASETGSNNWLDRIDTGLRELSWRSRQLDHPVDRIDYKLGPFPTSNIVNSFAILCLVVRRQRQTNFQINLIINLGGDDKNQDFTADKKKMTTKKQMARRQLTILCIKEFKPSTQKIKMDGLVKFVDDVFILP